MDDEEMVEEISAVKTALMQKLNAMYKGVRDSANTDNSSNINRAPSGIEFTTEGDEESSPSKRLM